MLISVPYVLISKAKAFFLEGRQVLKTEQKPSQTNPFSCNRAFFSILFEKMQIREKKWSADFRILDYSLDMTFLEFSTKSLSGLQRRVFVGF